VAKTRGRSWRRRAGIRALAYRADGRRSRVLLCLHDGPVRSAEIVRFLAHLRRHVRARVTLLWHGLGAHPGGITRAHVGRQRSWLRTARLPGYAPELNPVEGLWAWLQQRQLANGGDRDLAEITARVRVGVSAGRRRPGLLLGFLAKAGLTL